MRLDLVRSGASPLTTVAASAPAVTQEGSLAGSTLHLFEVRATDTSTVVTFGLTHPSGASYDDALRRVTGWAPILRAGDRELQPTRTLMYGNVNDSMPLVAQPHELAAEPRAMFASYPALPAGTSEVQVVSPAPGATSRSTPRTTRSPGPRHRQRHS